MAIYLEHGDFNYFILRDSITGCTLLFQTDWEYPSLATAFGWQPCHRSTDGTIDCPECGKTASEMIAEATAYLDEHVGDVLDYDPGYFDFDEE